MRGRGWQTGPDIFSGHCVLSAPKSLPSSLLPQQPCSPQAALSFTRFAPLLAHRASPCGALEQELGAVRHGLGN